MKSRSHLLPILAPCIFPYIALREGVTAPKQNPNRRPLILIGAIWSAIFPATIYATVQGFKGYSRELDARELAFPALLWTTHVLGYLPFFLKSDFFRGRD